MHPRVLAALGVISALIAGLLAYSGWQLAHATAPLDDYGPAPTFALTDQLGRPIESETLRGQVVLVNFIYTSCQDSCPLLTARMGGLQTRLRQEGLLGTHVVLLSLTVDPATDTPGVLREYAERHRADPSGWHFLTGPEEKIIPVIVQGFFQGVVPLPATPAVGSGHEGVPAGGTRDVMHSNRFVLIDRRGHMRVFYDGLEMEDDRVLRDLRTLLR